MAPERRSYSRGEHFSWRTVGGAEYAGVIVDVDSNVLYVRCEDGKVRPVQG